MLLNSTARILSSNEMPLTEDRPYEPRLKDNYDYYRACAIKLNLLADGCPEQPSEQVEYDRIQTDCIRGQLKVLKECAQQDITTPEDANYMMALWQEEVIEPQSDSQLSHTDRMIVQLFSYFQNSLKQT